MTPNVPCVIRRMFCQLSRWLHDCFTGDLWRFPNPGTRLAEGSLGSQVCVEQPILETEAVEGKRANIALALARINGVPLEPNGIFSFWQLVGKPLARRGFKPGRAIVSGQLRLETGGGLCQLSGILYHASLLAGLEIVERHSHSVDIYTDATRYTPLGSDATVAYGFKDLRIRNSTSTPIYFFLKLDRHRLTCSICSSNKIVPCTVEFAKVSMEKQSVTIHTRRYRPNRSNAELAAISIYRNKP